MKTTQEDLTMVEKYGDRYLVTKKLALTLVVFALTACAAVGILVYYVGVADVTETASDSGHDSDPEPSVEPEPEPTTVRAKLTDVRLPTHLVPLKYKLELVPFIIPDNFTIRGYAEVSHCHLFLVLRLR